MNSSKESLSALVRLAQRGQLGIRGILSLGMEPGLRSDLLLKLREYSTIEAEAHAIAFQRGLELRELEAADRLLLKLAFRLGLSGRDGASRIPERMIRLSTRNMAQGQYLLKRVPREDHRVRILLQRLLDCELAGVVQLRLYLSALTNEHPDA